MVAAASSSYRQVCTQCSSHVEPADLLTNPELRNAIFAFAKEESNEGYLEVLPYALKVHKQNSPSSAIKWKERPWKYFGLTHTCKQVRAEYRPLWIRNLCMRILPSMFPAFAEAYLSGPAQELHAPKLIQFSWYHDVDNFGTKDTMPLLQLLARCPTVRYQYIPYKVSDLKSGPGDDMCEHCSEVIYLEEHGHSDAEDDVDGFCTCADADMDFDEWIMLQEDLMDYTEELRDFITNKNAKWRQDILDERMTVTHTFSSNRARTTTYMSFKIVVKEELAKKADTFASARDLLKEWGIFNLPCARMVDFVLAFEKEKTKTIHGYKVTKSKAHQVRFARDRPI